MERLATAITFVAMLWSIQTATAARPGEGTPPAIPPTALGTSPNCAQSYGYGVNSGSGGAPLQVAGVGDYCTEGQPRPVLWTAGTGTVDLGTVGGAGGGGAEAISDDGTVVGWLGGGVELAFMRPPGGPMEELPKLSSMTYATAGDISPNGQFVAGYSYTGTSGHGVRWDRSSGSWQPTEIPVGSAIAVSNNGAVAGSVPVTGSTTVRTARVWTERGSAELPGVDTRANGISADGTVVVGYRRQDVTCRRPPCGKYPVPMVWTFANDSWVAQELIALDGVDSEANAVAEVNGESVIVGYGYTKKDAIMRAVYWTPDAQGTYGAPTRLAGLDGSSGAYASAQDINSSGQVVGYSGILRKSPRIPSTIQAVMWQLP